MAAAQHLIDIFTSSGPTRPRFLTVFKPVNILCLIALLLPMATDAEVIHESGSLRGFMAGDEPAAEYDNWLSHVSEGIDNPGYNDYGPEWLDPQHNGFGAYRVVPNSQVGDRLLQHWRRIFDSFLLGHEVNVDALLQDSSETFHYDLVRFTDTDRNRDVFILREQLDSTFVDENQDGAADDVIGSFRNGWGLYIVDPDAPRPWLMIQMTHPCDDYIGVQAAIDLFFRLGAGAISINGAGREVVLRTGGGSTNSRSLSDPSRNGRAPFQVFHEAFADRFEDNYPQSAFVVQLHSFDRSNNHDTPVIISEGAGWYAPLLPYRDRQGGFNTIIQQTPEPPVAGGTYAGLGPLEIDPFYGINHIGGLDVGMPGGNNWEIQRPPSHLGDPNNVQAIHLHDMDCYEPSQAVAPFLHVEVDEWPEYLDDGGFELEDLVEDPRGVPTWEDYIPWMEFYDPFFAGLEAWLDWFTSPAQPLETSTPSLTNLTMNSNGEVMLAISEDDADYYRAMVEVVADTAALTADSPVIWSGFDDPELKKVRLDDEIIQVASPYLGRTVHFAVRSVELDGTRGSLSNSMSAIPNDLEGVDPVHQSFQTYPVDAWPAWISCVVEEDDQLRDIRVIWRADMSDPDTLEMSLINPAVHIYAVPLPEEGIGEFDSISYQILARDNSTSGNLVVLPNEGEWYSFEVVDSPTMIRNWDFESEPTEMELTGDWEWGAPETTPPGSAHSGSSVLGTNLDGIYTNTLNTYLTLEDVGRLEYGPIIISFHQFVDYPESEIPGVAEHGGLLWWVGDDIQGPVFNPAYDHRLPMYEGSTQYDVFSGTSEGWVEVVMDLTNYYGRMHDIQFYQPTSEVTPSRMGWYIDDLVITRSINTQPPLPVTLLTPEDGDTIRSESRTFSWTSTVDPDPRTQVEYIFRLSGDAGQFDSTGIMDTTITFDVRTVEWVGLGEHLLDWWVDAVSQGDTVANIAGPRTLVLPSLGVDESSELPKRFSLGSAYPNPFNAAVTIPYELPHATSVRLEVYNLLGQRVAVLENRSQTAGQYKTVWDAHQQASGLYFIRFEAGTFQAARKVLLIK